MTNAERRERRRLAGLKGAETRRARQEAERIARGLAAVGVPLAAEKKPTIFRMTGVQRR